MLRQAAELEGRTFTDFVTTALQDAARRAISAAHVLELSIVDQQIFATTLIDPPGAAPALERSLSADIAANVLVVDAKDEQSAAFYRHHGFIALNDYHLALFLPLATARAFLRKGH